MSVGNATQAIDFDRKDLTLVLGENVDLGGDDTGARNGTGKTTIINALSYGLYGNALTNIKKDNLINKTNSKGMLVTVEFEHNGQAYKIERGRKPNTMAFYIGDTEQEITDESQGDSRETQAEINRLLGMSHDMFKHIVALNTYNEPFLALKSNEQRAIIEQLLGITILSEKAEALKEQGKVTKDAITAEEARIKAVTDANKRIEEQIEALKRRQTLWVTKHAEETQKLQTGIEELQKIDIQAEIQAHQAFKTWDQTRKDLNELSSAIGRTKLDLSREEKTISKLSSDILSLENHTCHACGQDFHDEKHEQVLGQLKGELSGAVQAKEEHATFLAELQSTQLGLGSLGAKPITFYDKESDAIHHQATVDSLIKQLETKLVEQDPYAEQIADMKETAVEEIKYDTINELTSIKEHQEFLLKLLTNKDSFIRKRIIDQNLNYLNARLGQYLDRIGLPHVVKFNNDLTVSIEELGRELDFDNLSRGERNRLILSLSWAFRDVWENLYKKINLLFMDEVIDTGMDASGVENALAILKKMSREGDRSVWLVSHKDELAGRVNNILTVVKENGFTTYNTDIDIV
ncbi:endonuclease subunit [uncultured Caudovirales phage]|uniref:Endonuclease subunit n=1 Tax=uncultured Caudovirales phage TaxID=2100421 RepID=A0A6J5LB92_9CAUD|nr:endonuclease subunit [uncultured Caudovirales phage]